jgi:hypothetical protein
MKKWIIRKLIDLALWLDWREGIKTGLVVLEREINTPRPVGRPKGSKDKKPRKRPVRS